jgi:hypothetical protein
MLEEIPTYGTHAADKSTWVAIFYIWKIDINKIIRGMTFM